jgi:prepilin-type N-terminal cleavage/methylation domain-containing protein
MSARRHGSETRARRGERGFTLIETIIVLGLMGLVLTLLFGGLRFSATVWNVVQTKGAAAQESEASRRVVRRLLEGAQPARGPRGRLLFDGAADRIRFAGPPPAAARRGDRFDLVLEQDGDALMLRWRRFEPGVAETEGAPWQSRALTTAIEDVSFRYFAAAERNAKPAWHDVWRDRKTRPLLVEVTVTREAGPETLSARLRIDPPSGR